VISAGRAAAADAAPYIAIDDFAEWGIRALVTTRAAGSFSTASAEPVTEVMERWDALRRLVASGPAGRLATARQVHGADVVAHVPGWTGWLRGGDADGHVSHTRGTALAVSVADCVPVLLAHPSGASRRFTRLAGDRRPNPRPRRSAAPRAWASPGGAPRRARPRDLRLVLRGEPDVYGQLTGRAVERPTLVDLRAVLAGHARAAGVDDVRTSPLCTRCDNAVLYSHRAGDAGRQLGVIVADAGG
jgi:copper oxidase (laccase) domain-containing protein